MKIFDHLTMVRSNLILKEFVKIGLVFKDSIRTVQTGQRKISFKVAGDNDALDFVGGYLIKEGFSIQKDYCKGSIEIKCAIDIDLDDEKAVQEIYDKIDQWKN